MLTQTGGETGEFYWIMALMRKRTSVVDQADMGSRKSHLITASSSWSDAWQHSATDDTLR